MRIRSAAFISFLFLFGILPLFAAEPPSESIESRPVKELAERSSWLANMAAHRFSPEEVAAVFGVSAAEAKQWLSEAQQKPSLSSEAGKLLMLPYPGGRHPRIGFLEGAVRPQRETKVSLFAPWKDGGYVVVDLPEAVWHLPGGNRELLYLAHTHVPTIWDKQKVELAKQEWKLGKDGILSLTREFPNKVAMTSRAQAVQGGARLEFGISNHSAEKLTGLQVQMCAMLKGLNGFADQTNDNKIFKAPFAACKDADNRWVILGFDHCTNAWGNAPCPCLHADPQVPDCAPGETQTVRGWLSFYEGTEIQTELKRLEKVAFEPIKSP